MSIVGSWKSLVGVGSHCGGGKWGWSGCGRNTWIAGIRAGRLEKYRWHISMSAQTIVFSIDVVKNLGMSVEIMMASISFEI